MPIETMSSPGARYSGRVRCFMAAPARCSVFALPRHGSSRPHWYPPLPPARRAHILWPAIVDGRLEVLAQQGRHPALAADAAATALLELRLGRRQHGRLGHEVEEGEADGPGGREHRGIDGGGEAAERVPGPVRILVAGS